MRLLVFLVRTALCTNECTCFRMFNVCCINIHGFKFLPLSIIFLQALERTVSTTLGKMSKGKVALSSSEICAYIKVCPALDQNATDIFESLQTTRLEPSVSRATVFRWVRHFESGKSGISENKGKAKTRTMTSPTTVAAIKAIVDEDARVTVQEIADKVGIRSSSALRELHNDLELHELSARWVPNILSDQNKGVRLDYAQKLLKVYKNCDKRQNSETIIGDETWIYFFEPHRKSQNKIWRPKGASLSKIARRSKST